MALRTDFEYDAIVKRWVDGDTVDLEVIDHHDIGFHVTATYHYDGRFRLSIVDTPERGDPGYHEARLYCESIAPVGSTVRIITYPDKNGGFGRYLADVLPFAGETTTISSLLLQNGYAEVWS